MRIAVISAVVALCALLGGIWYATMPADVDGDKYAQCRSTQVAGGAGQIGGPFTLVNSAGETVTDQDVITKPSLLYFGYTFCPDVCPVDMARMARGLAKFSESEPELAAKIQPIFISVDPERDTPEVLDEFTSAFGENVIGLTGTKEQLDAAVKEFASFYGRGAELDNGHYLIDHTRFVFLFDPDGNPLTTLPTEIAGKKGTEAVAQELAKWVS